MQQDEKFTQLCRQIAEQKDPKKITAFVMNYLSCCTMSRTVSAPRSISA